MKPYFSILFALSLLSCNMDDTINENPIMHHGMSAGKSGETWQGFGQDAAGALYRVLRSELYDTESVTFEAIESHALDNTFFTQNYITSYQAVTQQEIETVKTNALADLDDFALSINLSSGGRQEFTALITALHKIKQSNGLRSHVTAFLEQFMLTVANQTDLSTYDTNLLLATADLLKHSYAADCDEGEDEDEDCDHDDDKDWELSIGHVAATAYGCSLSMGNAITCSLYGYYNP